MGEKGLHREICRPFLEDITHKYMREKGAGVRMKRVVRCFLYLTFLITCCSYVYAQDESIERNVYGKEEEFVRSIPLDSFYAEECSEKGTVETLRYTCHSYALEAVTGESDIMVEKSMNVYLPYGYDDNKEYDVLYLLHGTGGFEDYWIGDSSTGRITCNVLDNMIQRKECKPVIVVSPTYYSPVVSMGYRDMEPTELFDTEKDPYVRPVANVFLERIKK